MLLLYKIVMLNRYLVVLTTSATFKNFVIALNCAAVSLDAELLLFTILVEGNISWGFKLSLSAIPEVRELIQGFYQLLNIFGEWKTTIR